MYLLLAAIVLLVLFAASYGGPGTWVALASSTLSVLLVAAFVFITFAGSAGPYFNALAAQSPALLQAGVRDLAFAAERTAAARTETTRPPLRVSIAPAPVAPMPDNDDAPPAETPSEWLDLNWLDPLGWLSAAASWVNPWQWLQTQQAEAPNSAQRTASTVRTERAAPPKPQIQEPQAPLPTVRAMMRPREQTVEQRAAAAPSYRIVTVPPQHEGSVTASLPASAGTPVEWLSGVSPPTGLEGVLLSGKNGSGVPLEDIHATLKPDSGTASPGLGNITLSLRVEGPDGTLTPGAAIPPGARFHLQAETLTKEAAAKLGGAIVSFAYSQDGRRRTSIMYLKQSALSGDIGPQ